MQVTDIVGKWLPLRIHKLVNFLKASFFQFFGFYDLEPNKSGFVLI